MIFQHAVQSLTERGVTAHDEVTSGGGRRASKL